jgi:hypothetical protein
MRTILTLVCILSVTLSSKAQIGRNWAEGSYYDTSGHKLSGFISWHAPDKLSKKPGDKIFYKASKSADKIRIESSDLSSFTMGTDSFVVSRLAAINYAPVLQVLLKGPVNLYYWEADVVNWPMAALGAVGGAVAGATVIAGVGGGKAYFYGPDASNFKMLTRNNFIEIMCGIMTDRPEITEKIKNKKIRFNDMHDLLVYYKTGKMPEKSNDDSYN